MSAVFALSSRSCSDCCCAALRLEVLALGVERVGLLVEVRDPSRVGARRGFRVPLPGRDVFEVRDVADRDLWLMRVAVDVRRSVADDLLEPRRLGASGVELLLCVDDGGSDLGEALRRRVELGGQLREHCVVAAHLDRQRAVGLRRVGIGRVGDGRIRDGAGGPGPEPGRGRPHDEARERESGEHEGGDAQGQPRVGAHEGNIGRLGQTVERSPWTGPTLGSTTGPERRARTAVRPEEMRRREAPECSSHRAPQRSPRDVLRDSIAQVAELFHPCPQVLHRGLWTTRLSDPADRRNGKGPIVSPTTGPVTRDQLDERVAGQTVTGLFLGTVERHADAAALRWKNGAEYQVLTYAEYGDCAARVAAALTELGVGRGDRVVLMLRNRPEFHVADIAVLLVGAHPDLDLQLVVAEDQIRYLVRPLRAQVAIVEDVTYLERVTRGARRPPRPARTS